jgi:8-oxo-dGTP pyrophosphatase MutT (NUDIX family)
VTEVVEIRPAATVILVRDGSDGLEALLLRRNSQLAFHGGAWVFPGGRIEPADYPSGAEPDDPAHPDHDDAARVAAVREAHEECGLLGDHVTFVPFSHWTTPPGPPRRFATWFFLAEAPTGEIGTDGSEITDHRWMRPVDALAARAAGEIELPPPTFVSLTRLQRFATVADALDDARAATYLRYEPRLHRVEGGMVHLYAGDVAYDDVALLDETEPHHRLLSVGTEWEYVVS